jgi:hypothetical protein
MPGRAIEQVLGEHPEAVGRTVSFLMGEPTVAEMEAFMERTNLHLPEELLEEADKLVPRLAHVRDYRLMRLSRAMVLRLAIQEGLEVLRRKAEAAEQREGGE